MINYIAQFFVLNIDNETSKLPLPDPSDFSFVAQVNFDDIENELRRLKNELEKY